MSPFGDVHGPDRAAGVDKLEGEVESATDDAPVFIQMPEAASASGELTFSRCNIVSGKGVASRKVKYAFCGRAVTTSQHKMCYGHCLQTEAGILKCLDKERLREHYPEFVQKLEVRQAKLTCSCCFTSCLPPSQILDKLLAPLKTLSIKSPLCDFRVFDSHA